MPDLHFFEEEKNQANLLEIREFKEMEEPI